MVRSAKAKGIYASIANQSTKLGDLRNIAKEIRKDHALAAELWTSDNFHARMLAILIMAKKELTTDAVNGLFIDMQSHQPNEQTQLADWLMANQLTKDKKLVALMQSWQNDKIALKRRIFWYYQGRLRWTGQVPPNNTEHLLSVIEQTILKEEPEVQWAMNFTAGWIGVFDKNYRGQCLSMGEKNGLYKGDFVHKNCTPNYLPEFISIEAAKRNL